MNGDSTITQRIEFRTFATTHGSGPFHPAIRDLSRVMYWPNITFDNEDEAHAWAEQALKPLREYVNRQALDWNIWPV